MPNTTISSVSIHAGRPPSPLHADHTSFLHPLQDFVDPINNFGAYRNALVKAIGQADAAQEGPHSWVVPFFSLIVKDIYFLHQGKSDRDDRGYIHFDKCMSLARLVSQILSYKDRVVRFLSSSPPSPSLQIHTIT